MLILLRGKINADGEEGFVLLRGLIAMFIILICFSGILFSLATISRGSSMFMEKVYAEINQRNEDAIRALRFEKL
ncbi:MAG: hypothetical protein FWD87_10800 [Spirochaetaceae bacterium]|nr:hypothetical protein [Spirochaetaceae bacterium]